MYILIRLFPYLVGITSLASYGLVLADLNQYWQTTFVVAIFLIFASWLITKHKTHLWDSSSFILIPLLFYISSFFFLLFLEGKIFQYIYIVFVSFILGLYLEKTLIFFWQPEKHKPRALAHLSIFINIITIFFAAVALFSLSVYIRFPLWLLLLGLTILLTLMSGFNFWSNKIELKKSLAWRVALVISFIELFFLLNFWPNSFYVKGILFTSLYCLANLIAVKNTSQSLTGSIVWKNSLLVALLWLITLLTARW
jgi:hypothetical protein